MKSLAAQLDALFKEALAQVIGDECRTTDPLIRPAGEEKFGDYQSNVAMGLAKRLGQMPRDVAQKVVDTLKALPEATQWCEPFEIAGPGFINIRLKSETLAAALSAIPDNNRLGIERTPTPQVVVVDYSSPNVAKQMHVGHLRSTIIGDGLARILEFVGHEVLRQNHLGDWGTQMGIILVAYEQLRSDSPTVDFTAIAARYKEFNARMETDTALREQVRAKLQALQKSDPSSSEWQNWERLRSESIFKLNELYDRLGVELVENPTTSEDISRIIGEPAENRKRQPKYCGESWYRHDLQRIVNELHQTKASSRIEVRENQGALCVFLNQEDGTPVFKGPEGDPLPLIVQKSDGTYLYATTDLAAIRFRVDRLGANRIIYVVGAPQKLHFEMVFATVRALGWAKNVKLEHVDFGSVLGENQKMLGTRKGENIKLAELVEEAVKRAEQLIRENEADPEKKRGFTEEEIRDIAEAVGIGAVKYADLSQNRQSDYVFSWDKMLAMEGNTAPYLMYAYARVRSIYRKGVTATDLETGCAKVFLNEPAERALGRQILRFAETIDSIAGNLKLNVLTDYLYELAGAFMRFYENCPVLTAPTAELRASRLKLCDLTALTLHIGLDLLGIRVVERM